MPVVAQSSKSPTSLEAGGESASRADFVSHQLSVSAVGVGVAVAGLAIEGQPAAADRSGSLEIAPKNSGLLWLTGYHTVYYPVGEERRSNSIFVNT